MLPRRPPNVGSPFVSYEATIVGMAGRSAAWPDPATTEGLRAPSPRSAARNAIVVISPPKKNFDVGPETPFANRSHHQLTDVHVRRTGLVPTIFSMVKKKWLRRFSGRVADHKSRSYCRSAWQSLHAARSGGGVSGLALDR